MWCIDIQLNDENEQPTDCVKTIEVSSKDAGFEEISRKAVEWYENYFDSIKHCSCGHRHIHAEFDKKTKTMSYVVSDCACADYIMHTVTSNPSEIKEKWRGEVEYYRYIESKDWKIKAGKRRIELGMRCVVCGRGFPQVELHVHHNTYKNLGHELPIDLTVLCEEHHAMFEATGGIKRYNPPSHFREGRILLDDLIRAGVARRDS